MEFKELRSGLYVWNPTSNHNDTNKRISSYSFLALVSANKENFTPEEVKRAEKARDMYRYAGAMGYAKFIRLLANNYYRNCPLTADDAKRALHIFGKDIIKIKASATRKRPSSLGIMAPSSIPEDIWVHHQTEILGMDYLFVQNLPHFHLIRKSYKMRTVDALIGKGTPNKEDMKESILKAINMYHARSITITQINADNQFACVGDDLPGIDLNIVVAGEHIGNAERSIRTIKDGTRYHVHRLPYRRYPIVMVRGCITKISIAHQQKMGFQEP